MSSDVSADIQRAFIEADLVYSQQEVELAIERLAREISTTLAERDPLVLCVMNGGLLFTGTLLKHLLFPLQLGYLHATRYRNTTSGHNLEWKAAPPMELQGRTLLILDDILDEGHTLQAICAECRARGAAELYTAVLIDKQHSRKAHPGLKADFTALSVEDRYVFGYGMDYKGYWRNAPGIYALRGH